MKINVLQGNPTAQIEDKINYIIERSDTIVTQDAVLESEIEAEGDILVGLGAGSVTRLPIGTLGYILTVDTAVSGKLKYAKPLIDEAGWMDVSDTWTYRTATSVNVPDGAEDRYSVGDKLMFTQTTVKIFYIVGVATGILTLTGGSDYTVANAAISAIAFSKSVSPVGFPQWFALTTSAWTTSATAFTNQPAGASYFTINGKTMIVRGQYQCHATSGGTGIFTATFTAGEMPTMPSYSVGSAANHSAPYEGFVRSSGVTILMSKYDASALATNSQYFGWVLATQIA